MHKHDDVRAIAPPHAIDALRAEIDRLDDALLELIEQRLAAALAIAKLKQAEGGQCLKIRPRREQAVIERLVAKARNAPPEVIAQIWRTVMSYSLQAQVQTELILCSGGDRSALVQQVRTRFGDAAPIRWAANAEEALEAARGSEAVAVVAPDLLDLSALGDTIYIFDAIRDRQGNVAAIAAGRVAPEDAMDGELVQQCLLSARAQSPNGEAVR